MLAVARQVAPLRQADLTRELELDEREEQEVR